MAKIPKDLTPQNEFAKFKTIGVFTISILDQTLQYIDTHSTTKSIRISLWHCHT